MSRPLTFLPQVPPKRCGVAPPFFACTRGDERVGAAQVQVAGELKLAGAPRLTEVLRVALREARLVVLDLRELTFLDAAGVRAIVDASIHARRNGRRLHLVVAPHRAQRVFTPAGAREHRKPG